VSRHASISIGQRLDLTLIQFPYENIDLRLCARVVVIKVLFMEHVRRVFILLCSCCTCCCCYCWLVGLAKNCSRQQLRALTEKYVANDYICLLHGHKHTHTDE